VLSWHLLSSMMVLALLGILFVPLVEHKSSLGNLEFDKWSSNSSGGTQIYLKQSGVALIRTKLFFRQSGVA
jgi:hypothetical protein